MPEGYAARPEQAILFTIDAWDVNCPRHIPRKLDAADVASVVEQLQQRVGELEAEIARLREQYAGTTPAPESGHDQHCRHPPARAAVQS